ncbi:MAG: hypothetical protein NVS1B10_05820 [Candidatus Saccharimonadales bacterium]
MKTNILTGSSNEDYHANRSHVSSSGLKLLLKSPEQFYSEYVMGTPSSLKGAFLDEGSFVHSLILEKHKVATEYAVFDGLRKQGKAWDAFLAANSDKTVMSAPQVLRCERLFKSYERTKLAVELVSGGFPEHSMLADLMGIGCKARADYINVERGYIVDVKTTAMPSGREFFKQTIEQYQYDLSAALYCSLAHENYSRLFDFYFLVLSKADGGCAVYRASTELLSAGSAKVTQALVLLKKCRESGNWTANQPNSFSTQHEIEEI